MLAGVAFLLVFGAFLAAVSIGPITRHTLSPALAFGLGVWLFGAAVAVSMLVPSILKLKPSAIRLSVTGTDFTLTHLDGRVVRKAWSDPALDFELGDASDVNPAKLLSGVPYSITVDGVHSQLTKEAYVEMLNQVSQHGLIDSVARGSRWVFSADANPLIHHIRPRAGNSSV